MIDVIPARQVWTHSVLAGALILLAACGAAATGSGATPASDSEAPIVVIGDEFRFTPANVRAKAGQPLTIMFRNDGKLDHDWAITRIPLSGEHAEGSVPGAAASDDHAGAAGHMASDDHAAGMDDHAGAASHMASDDHAAGSEVSDDHAASAAATHQHAGDLPDVHVAAGAGAMEQVQFTPEEAGQYEISCTIPGHKESGMHGILTVQN